MPDPTPSVSPLGSGRPGGEGESRCASCRQLRPHSELDADRWCPDCRDELRRKARIGSHLTAAAITVPFGVWVLLEGSSEVLSPWAWVLPLVPAYYLGYRIGREAVKGWVRLQRRRGR